MAGHYQFPTKLKGANSPPPIGRCIYCDSIEEPLTKEHIVPESLRGNLTLLRASCEKCREVTRKFETTIAREVFQDVRAAHGFRIKEPPVRVPMRAGPGPNAPVIDHISPDDAPRFLSLFVAEPAGIFTGRPRGSPFKVRHSLVMIEDAAERIHRRMEQGLPAKFHRPFHLPTFARFLGKIALGMGVYTAGLESFDPSPIRRLILGEDKDWSYLVGGTTEEMISLAPPDRGHRITVFQTVIEGVPWAAVQIQLFAHLRTPAYSVFIGELNEAGIKKFDPKDHILYTRAVK